MLRLSKLTDYGVVVLVRLAVPPEVQAAPGISTATGIPEPTVAKVLKALAAGGLVCSQRGAHGGYRLARGLEVISVAEVITAIEGPIALAACVAGSAANCDVLDRCALRGRWDPVNAAIREALGSISLADMKAFEGPHPFHIGSLTQLAAQPAANTPDTHPSTLAG